MNTAMKILPELTESVVTIQERVQGLCASIAKIEAALTQLNEDTVSHQISGWKKEQIAVADAYQRKKEDELRELELKLKKSREVVVDERMQKVLSRSISIEIEAEKEKDRVRAELDQQIQQSMHEYLIYGGFGSTTKSPSSEGTNKLDFLNSLQNFCLERFVSFVVFTSFSRRRTRSAEDYRTSAAFK